jgi:glycosyltransferase involved in cell wall biosynthesis
MQFSVIIPAYNENDYLPATLDLIKKASIEIEFPFEIIVVDNDSTDGTKQLAESFGVRVISENEHNIAKVRNTGAKTATGDILIFVDADTHVPEKLFQKIAVEMQNEKCFGGAVVVNYDNLQRRWIRFYLLGWKFWERFLNTKQGATQFCRKAIFEEIGGYDEKVFMGEDVEFYWRLTKSATQKGGYLYFIDNLPVTTSARRFNKMSIWKIILLTHPVFIWLASRKKSVWKDWYEKAVR